MSFPSNCHKSRPSPESPAHLQREPLEAVDNSFVTDLLDICEAAESDGWHCK